MSDLDYAPVIGRFGITVGDGSDPDETPDTIWCDAGVLRITPLQSPVRVAGASPMPWTGGNAAIDGTFDDHGHVTWNDRAVVWVVDLTSEKVNPSIGPNLATHKLSFSGVKAGGTDVEFPEVNVRLAADTMTAGVHPETGDPIMACDLTKLMPVQVGPGTAIVVGPRGFGIEDVTVVGDSLEVELEDGSVKSTALPVTMLDNAEFVGDQIATDGTPAQQAVIAQSEAVIEAEVPGIVGPMVAGQLSTPSPARTAAQAAATVTSFYDDFTTRPDATIAVGGSYVSTSGHTVHVRGQLPAILSGGRLTNVQTNTAQTQSTYLTVDFGQESDDTVGLMCVEYEVLAGTDPLQSFDLIAGEGDFGPPDFTDVAAHCGFTDTSFRYDTLEATNPGLVTTILARGQYKAHTPGTYRAEIAIDGTRATITDPRGRRWLADPSTLVAARNGRWATFQLYNLSDGLTKRQVRVLRWGAELQKRTKRGPYASPADLATVAAQPGRLLGAMQTTGAGTATAITTSLSAKLYGITVPIPPSRRVLIEGMAWFDETVPVVPATQQLLLGVYPSGVSGLGKLTTIVSGRTQANNTADAAAFADRQGAMTGYARGGLIPFSLILDLDPSFQIGDPIDFQVKAQAFAASQYTFVNSGDASGGTATLRRSTLKVTELAAV